MSNYEEKLLPDDYPVFKGYWYLFDEMPWRSKIDGTVADLKKKYECLRIKSCDMHGRGLEPAPWRGISFGGFNESPKDNG